MWRSSLGENEQQAFSGGKGPLRNLLEWSVRALAQPADIQLSLFPDFVCKGDELALSFEDGLYELVGHEDEINEEQKAAIQALDALITALSGKHNADFWINDDAVRSDERWERIRVLARRAIEAFEWDPQAPPPSSAIYITAGPQA